MSYKTIKIAILVTPTLVIGIWEYVRHQFLMPFISMELGNVLTPIILFLLSVTLLYKLFFHLEQMQEELQRERALKARLEQREQLARELHDGIAQSLFLLSVKVDKAERRQMAADQTHDWQELRKTIHEVNRYVREAIADLRVLPDAREDDEANGATFPARIRQMAQEQQLELQLHWQLEEDEAWSPKARMELLACIREAIVNAGKHAGVREIRAFGEGSARRFRVRVIDSGVGFPEGDQERPGSYGLRIMRERAEGMGWRLEITSRPGHTIVEIQGGEAT
ncbi:histidine kinase [Paenibacillus phocaensis]|uniref:histidine kinase n=1 Tax=Paenibacillus phocaensis TaxID=1776378 RepID=UPI000839D5E9|nr:histidine kinase [Paenibacillus phocaensis]